MNLAIEAVVKFEGRVVFCQFIAKKQEMIWQKI
jgi:hypothetical protein